ncbi:MAG: HipA domain-containing protein [Bdellovibrionales bacterium]|nr:HipA domain-containing protein [Bdellovibrionales bacterium]
MNNYCYVCNVKLNASKQRVHGLHPSCFMEAFSLDKIADFKDVAIKHQESSKNPHESGSSKLTTSFFHGKFRKYSANLNGQTYILKVQEENYLELPVTEYLCNQIAVKLGVAVPKFALIEFQNSITAFVTRNFMQDYVASNLIHLYHFTNDEKDWNCEFLINLIAEKTGKLIEIERFVEVCLFDALIGNNDRHGRNLGLIQQGQKYILSPIYDNPSNVGVELKELLGAQLEPRGSIATKASQQPTMKDYVIEFNRLEYGYLNEKFLKKIEKKKDIIKSQIDKSYLSIERKTALRKLMNRRYLELANHVE